MKKDKFIEQPWTKFVRGTVPLADLFSPQLQADVAHLAEQTGKSKKEITAHFLTALREEIWMNSIYQVNVRRDQPKEEMPELVHLSIKRRDKASNIPWRHLQRIKNELLGPELEAVELFPAESRLVDLANQRHLWCFNKEGWQWPFGFQERAIGNGTPTGSAKNDKHK